MLEKLSKGSVVLLQDCIHKIERKKKRAFMEHFIVRIINNSENTETSVLKISKAISNYGYNEDLVIEQLVDIFEKENNDKLDKLCHFYND